MKREWEDRGAYGVMRVFDIANDKTPSQKANGSFVFLAAKQS